LRTRILLSTRIASRADIAQPNFPLRRTEVIAQMPRGPISIDPSVRPETSLHTKGRFEDSIAALLDIAREEAGADGYAFYEMDEARGKLVLRLAHPMVSREPAPFPVQATATPLRILARVGDTESAILSFPLFGEAGLAGVLDFSFKAPGGYAPVQRELLQRTAAAVAGLLKKGRTPPVLVQLVARLAEKEAGLADLKIAERARGLAEQSDRSDRSEVLLAHVASVLESCRVEQALIAQLNGLDEQLQERRLVARAKTALQEQLQITEEQAYLRIRQSSRRTRKRLSEVATAVLRAKAEPRELERLTA